MDEAQEIIKEFLVESHENLDELDRNLVALEQAPESHALLSGIFRTIHTIKGTCGFLGFGKLERVTHVGESLLSKLRDGELELRPDVTNGLLSLVDAIRAMLGHIEGAGTEGEDEYQALIELLSELQESRCPASAPPAGLSNQPAPDVPNDKTRPASPKLAQQIDALLEPTSERARDATVTPPRVAGNDPRTTQMSESSIRVDVSLLDKLMNQVGELVLARNQVLQFTNNLNDSAFVSTSQRLNLITTELQEGVMKTRMQPIGNIWSKFPRVVRDLALQCGKKVRIEMEGKETELDKTIVEAIKDPLTHLVRNSVDHGIESPEARRAQGKPEEGCLQLRAFHEGGQVNIEISDDGGGLNLDRIRQKALERGLVSRDQTERMSERDTAQLIFAPGFSTAASVTNVSGRGVGMDVVKTNIEKIGGTVDIQTQPQVGTSVKLKIPLTLAIIPALVVTCADDRYAIPQVSLLELVRLEGEQARKGIERLHGAPVYRLRGQLLPIVDLRRELAISAKPEAAETQEAGDQVINIVVLRADDRQFGLVVDAINDTEEIVVKPLSKQLKGIPVYAGATIMGDGTVALILDVLGTAQRAHVVSQVRDRATVKQSAASQDQGRDVQTLLILEVGSRRLALPISMVARLEEIAPTQLEFADHREVVQYRGQILPLVRLGEVLGLDTSADPDRPLQVVVYSQQGQSVGLVVDRIADIIESSSEFQRSATSKFLMGSKVIQGRVTDLLNLPAIIGQYEPTCAHGAPTASTT